MLYVLGRVEVLIGILWRNLKERNHLEILRVNGRVALELILKTQDGGVDWIGLVQYRNQWGAFVNMVTNRRSP